MTEGRFVAFDGTPIFYRRFTAAAPVAAALIVHGMGEHGGRYEHLAGFLAAAGVESIVPDLRGFGLSGGGRGCLRRLEDHHADLSASLDLLSRQSGVRPVFIIGHSFGGLLTATLLSRFPTRRIAGAVLSSPIFGIAVPVPIWRHALGWSASWLLPNLTQATGVRPDTLTHDPQMLKRYATDTLIHHRISSRLYRILTSTLSQRADIAKRIKRPLLVLQADQDHVVSRDATVRFFHEVLSTDKELEIYPGFYHEILNEIERERVFARISRWILSHATNSK